MIKELTSESFTEIVLSIKFTKAKNLLESTTYPISQKPLGNIEKSCYYDSLHKLPRK